MRNKRDEAVKKPERENEAYELVSEHFHTLPIKHRRNLCLLMKKQVIMYSRKLMKAPVQ